MEKELKICSHLIILTTFLLKSIQLRGERWGREAEALLIWARVWKGRGASAGMNNEAGAEVAGLRVPTQHFLCELDPPGGAPHLPPGHPVGWTGTRTQTPGSRTGALWEKWFSGYR